MKKRKQIFAVPFRNAAGKIGLIVPSDMTIEDAVRLGIEIKIVPKEKPMESNEYRHDCERDRPK